jgi:hypothetical protein
LTGKIAFLSKLKLAILNSCFVSLFVPAIDKQYKYLIISYATLFCGGGIDSVKQSRMDVV